MKGIMKKIISALLVLIMLVSLVPTTVFAAEAEEYVDPVYAYYQATVYSDGFQSACGSSSTSYANNYFSLMREDGKLMAAITAWEGIHIATEPSYSLESGLISKKDMFKLVIFDLLDVNNSVDSVSNQQANYVFEIASTILGSDDIDISELESFEVTAEYLDILENGAKAAKMVDVLSIGSKIADASANMYDAVNAYASYQSIANMKNGTKEILTAITELSGGSLGEYFDDEDLEDLKAAARECVSYFDDAYDNVLERILSGTEPYSAAAMKTALGLAMDWAWDYIVAAIPGGAAVMVAAKGIRILANAVFELDEQNQAYYQLETLVAFENAIRYIMTDAASDYKDDKNLDKAVYYMQTVNMYKNVVLLGFDYSANLLEVQASAPATKWFDWLTGDYTECINLINDINELKSDKIQTYSYYEERVYSIYKELYCPDYDNVINSFNNQTIVEIESLILTQIKDINIGDTGYIGNYIDVDVSPSNANQAFFENFSSENEDVIKLNEFDQIEVVGSGECTIVCQKDDKLETSITVIVGSEPSIDEPYDYLGDFTYTIDAANESVTITGYKGNSSSLIIPSTIGGYPVKNIGEYAFEDNTTIRTIKLPSSVTSIEDYAFFSCTKLKSITLPDSLKTIGHNAFEYCISLESITIPDGVTSIGYAAFYICESLESVTIPDSLTSIGAGVFACCISLKDVYINDIAAWLNLDFNRYYDGDSEHPLCFADNLYLNGKLVKDIVIPDGVTSIPSYAFSCTSLESITIPDSVTSISGDAFCGCTSLKNVTIPDSITRIDGSYTFRGCTSLESITIPNSVTDIGFGTFYDCTSLKNITIPDSITRIDGSYIFRGCTSLESITIPNSVTDIGLGNFYDCTSLKNITIPDSVTRIGNTTFKGCTSLKSITIPDSVTFIDYGAFDQCDSLCYVFYAGSEEQWNKIGIDEKNESLINAKVYFNGEKPELPTNTVESTVCDTTAAVEITTSLEENTTTIITEPTEATVATTLAIVTDAPETEPCPVESVYYLRGTMCDWEVGTAFCLNDDSSASLVMTLDAGTYTFKVYNSETQTWYGNTGTIEDEATGWTFRTTAGNCTLVATGGTYVFKAYTNYEGKFKVDVTMLSPEEPTEATTVTTEVADTEAPLLPGEIPEGLEYSIVDGEAVITGYTGSRSKLIIPDTIKEYPVTIISPYAFERCTTITSITLPEGLQIINDGSFNYCYNLEEIYIPQSVIEVGKYAFSGTAYYNNKDNWDNDVLYIGTVLVEFNGDSSSKYIVKSGTTVIADAAFFGRDNLEGVVLSEELISIGYEAFRDCTSLAGVSSVPDGIIRVGYDAFYNTAFYNSSSNWNKGALYIDYILLKVKEGYEVDYTIANGTRIIADGACKDCTNLTGVSIPDSVTRIGRGAFSSCYTLTSVTIPDSVLYIDWYAFNYCSNLESVKLPERLTIINDGLFMSCEKLKEVKIPENVTVICGGAFSGCYSLENLTIPDSVNFIGNRAFYECLALINVELPETLKELGGYAFNSCKDLESITIPDGVITIKEYTFEGSGIESITIPASVTIIDDCAFDSCSGLSDVYFVGTEEQWNDISIGKYNTDLLNANIRFAPLIPSQDVAFSGASLTLHDNISINFKANESLFTEVGYENPYVVYELNGEEFIVSDYEIVGGKYVFDFADIAPNNMNDTVKATLYATFDGVEYASETREYSVATYCYNMLNKYTTAEYAELQTLLVDLLNYGAMSQIYTNYNTENLVNANLTDAQKAWGTSVAPTYETVQNVAYKTIENPTVTWKGGGLNLVDAVTMRFKITADSGSYENLEVKVETDDRIWTIPYEEFSETTGGYYVYFSGLNAGEMSEPVYLTVYENGEAVSNTLSYSIESYVYSKQNSTDTNLTNLLEAMMKYGNSAYAYAN